MFNGKSYKIVEMGSFTYDGTAHTSYSTPDVKHGFARFQSFTEFAAIGLILMIL